MNTIKTDRSNYKYIYNIRFANFLMLNNVMCRGTGVNENSHKIFWAFDYNECQPIYDMLALKKAEN